MSRFSKTFIRLFLATVLIGPAAQISNAQAVSRETSITKLREGAEAGNADAQLQLGLAYQEGKGVTQSYAEAARWFRKAADAGYDPAQCVLGVAYQAGKGVAQDYAEAARWFRKAAQSGNADGGLLLGLA
ncbi:MAG TPA: tetratricopeptide repeat protein, partial [Bryobacteraceae bacterium]|nr:tetratricopeptide repeat protein [Bryobacteraceae bacterium]